MSSYSARRKLQRTIELVSAVLLALGGAATTYCSYQASLWGGHQAADYARAGAARTESTKVANRAGQLMLIDVTSFMAWLQAKGTGQAQFEGLLHERLRKEFRPIFDDWLSKDPLYNTDAPATPFGMLSYQPADQVRAEELASKAEELFRSGQIANSQTDHYLMATIIFAMALFFASVGHQFRRLLMQFFLMGVSVVLLGIGVYKLVQLPRVGPMEVSAAPSPRPEQK